MSDPVMKTKRLALELAALEPARRERLLAELPEDKRTEMARCINEAAPMIAGRLSAFEQVLSEFEQAPHDFDETSLGLVLAGESIALKRQLTDVFVRGQDQLLSSHVRELVMEHLRAKKAEVMAQVPATQPIVKRPAWYQFWSRLK
jgi:hypothetical protein